MFDNAKEDDRGKRAANNELIDNLFVKRNGKWEMNLSAPIFEQAKVRCYLYLQKMEPKSLNMFVNTDVVFKCLFLWKRGGLVQYTEIVFKCLCTYSMAV